MKHRFAIFAALALAVLIASLPTQGLPRVHAANATTTTTLVASSTSLQAQIDANNQQITTLDQEIATDQAELLKAGADKKTLQAAINALDLQRNKVQTQVAVTERQIATTQLQIQQLGGEISDTKQTITTDQEALGATLLSFQKSESQPLLMKILSFDTLSEVWSDTNANLEIQAPSRIICRRSKRKKTISPHRKPLRNKNKRRSPNNSNHSRNNSNHSRRPYNRKTNCLRQRTQKNLPIKNCLPQQKRNSKASRHSPRMPAAPASSGIRPSATLGVVITISAIRHGAVTALNGTKYRLASDGCLVASMAMVLTHYGYHDVTPVTINANSG